MLGQTIQRDLSCVGQQRISRRHLPHLYTAATGRVQSDWRPRVQDCLSGVVTIDDNVGTVVCSRLQAPLLLAYALTVHRAQGMTLDAMTLHTDGLFAKGQLYTALAVFETGEHTVPCSKVPNTLRGVQLPFSKHSVGVERHSVKHRALRPRPSHCIRQQQGRLHTAAYERAPHPLRLSQPDART